MTNLINSRPGCRFGGMLCAALLFAAGCADEPLPPPAPSLPHCSDAMIFFANGASDLSEKEAQRLKAYVNDKPSLNSNPCGLNPDPIAKGMLFVIGYTDGSGSDGANQRLALKRAQTVANRLVEIGFAPEKLCVLSGGRRRRIVPTSSVEPQNRVVVIERRITESCE